MRVPILLIRLIGLLLCAGSVLITLDTPTAQPGQSVPVLLTVLLPQFTPWMVELSNLGAPFVIGICFWYCTSFPQFEQPSQLILLLLALQTVLAILISPELQFVIAVEAGLLLSPRSGGIWVLAQTAAMWVIALSYPQLMTWIIPATQDRVRQLVGIGLFMLFAMLYNLLAFSLGWLFATQRRQASALDLTNRSLERTNSELKTAQYAAAEAARLHERLSIARELHDAIGHQLTALSVNLQVATHLSHDDAREHVMNAYQLAGELLTEVRSVVSTNRDLSAPDFISALQAFALRLEEPKIHLSLASIPETVPRQFSHALFRCAQEIITNTMRHAEAKNLWIDSTIAEGRYELRAKDDGRGRDELVFGNGLSGITERIRELKGEALFETQPRHGFSVVIWLPLSEQVG